MQDDSWVNNFVGAITVCDPEGIILEMNAAAAKEFAVQGGTALIGGSLLDCHPEPSRSRVKDMLVEQKPNTYTFEKNGVKKFIYQTPWYTEEGYAGFVELILPVPAGIPHHSRD